MYVLQCTTIRLKQECGHKISRHADMNLRFKPTAKIGQFFVPTSQKMRLCVDVIWRHSLYVVLPIDMYKWSYWHHTFSNPSHCIEIHRWAIIEELSIRPTVRTFMISWGQKTRVKCWFIVMIWGLVYKYMYWYERHFGSFYRDPTILETVSIASQWVNTDWLKSCFWWTTTKGNITSTNVTMLR